MKISKIAQICKKTGQVYMLDGASHQGQWIGDGRAFYAVSGIPAMTEESILTLFDVPQERRDAWIARRMDHMPGTVSLDDYAPGEEPVGSGSDLAAIVWRGNTYRPIRTSQGIVLLPGGFLAPLMDEKAREGVVLFERKMAKGGVYIAVKTGIFLRAVIVPAEFDAEIAAALGEMAREYVGRTEQGVDGQVRMDG